MALLSLSLVNELLPELPSFESNFTFPFYTSITAITNDSVESQIQILYRNYKQQLYYYRDVNVLACECSCSTHNTSCDHIIVSLLHIKNELGADFFSSKYLENYKNKIAQMYGLEPHQTPDDLFNFFFTLEGLSHESKFKNLQTNVNLDTIINKDLEVDRLLVKVSTESTSHTDYKTAYVFTKSIRSSRANPIQLFPIIGKLNKQRTEISSNIKHLSNFTIIDDFNLLKNDEVLLDLMNLIKAHETYSYDVFLVQAYHSASKISQIKPPFYFHKRNESLVRKNLIPLTWSDSEVKLFFTFTDSSEVCTLKAKLNIADKNYNLASPKILVYGTFLIIEQVIYTITDFETAYYVGKYIKMSEINYLKRDLKTVIDEIIMPLTAKFEVQTNLLKKQKGNFAEDQLEKQVYLSDLDGEFVVFKLATQYPNKLVPITSNELIYDSEKDVYLNRNQAFEDNFREEFTDLHPAFDLQTNLFYLQAEQLIENYWLIKAVDKMKTLGIKVFGVNDLKSFKFNVNKPVIKIGVASNLDWFDLNIEIKFGSQKVSLKDLQNAFVKKINYVTLGDGTLGVLPEDWIKKFSNFFKVGEVKKNAIQLSNYQFGVIDELFNELESKPPFFLELLEKKKRLQNINEIESVKIPKGINATLRDYQHHGLNWMVFLDKYKLGGCLADDMGLGKTLQAITFLQYLKLQNKNKNQVKTSLIIAPTSLIFNWKNELEKFCPSLDVLLFVGADRMNMKNELLNYDIVISTYGSLLNDIEVLSTITFNYIILDESQSIKNTNSKRYKSVRLLKAHNRLALTGTPIENNTFDLYAQMNFLNPGLLGNMVHFKKEFSDTIDKEKDMDAAQLLSQMISPFLLRRTKDQVAKELPDKTESIIYCEMGSEQRKVYESYKNKYREYLLNKIDENGAAKSQLFILEGLTKLRQICNSTALLSDDADYGDHSVKLDILIETIVKKTGKHKILVFSQFVKMLQLIKHRLDDENIHYEYLDGQSTKREDKVSNFQNNQSVRVFLISLKAGGVGLNLTEADYVFLVDPWWNPAVENQAIDRCYRIGQTQQVMAYRMICKDSIEDKIMTLQGNKKIVATSIIQVDEEQKSFDLQQVRELFS